MDTCNRDAGCVLNEQLRRVYAEIEHSKTFHLELLKAISPCEVWLVGLKTSELGTSRASKKVRN
jgi:hypothetical protein